MPKNKNKGAETPAPVTTTNPFADMSQETRWLLSRKIDEEIAGLERTAQELIATKHLLVSASIQTVAAMEQQGPRSAPTGVIPPVPTKKRGRPAGSKNKPKQDNQPDQPAPAEQPAQPDADQDQGDLFQSAVAATRPERDQEFAQAS